MGRETVGSRTGLARETLRVANPFGRREAVSVVARRSAHCRSALHHPVTPPPAQHSQSVYSMRCSMRCSMRLSMRHSMLRCSMAEALALHALRLGRRLTDCALCHCHCVPHCCLSLSHSHIATHNSHAHRHRHRHHPRARRHARTTAAGARLGSHMRGRQHRRVLPPRADLVHEHRRLIVDLRRLL